MKASMKWIIPAMLLLLMVGSQAGQVAAQNGTVLFRVNNGGPEIAATDGGPTWSEDQATSNANGAAITGITSEYLTFTQNNENKTFGVASLPAQFVNNTTLPDEIFETERFYDQSQAMQWDFPVVPGTYEVNLYMAEIWNNGQNAGARLFDITVEGTLEAEDFSIFSTFGGYTADVLSYEVTVTDGNLDLDLSKGSANNPKVSAIEVVQLSTIANAAPTVEITSPADNSTVTAGDAVTFTGSANDAEDGDLSASIDWVSDLDGDLGTDGATFDSSTLSVGEHTITASVTDSGNPALTGSASITLTVEPLNPPNEPPVLDPLADWNSFEGDVIAIGTNASDPETDSLVYNISGAPAGIGIDSDGLINGTINDAAGTYSVTVSVDDGNNSPVSQTFDWNVNPAVAEQCTVDTYAFAVNFGGAEYTAADGRIFLADSGSNTNTIYGNGKKFGTQGDAIANTEIDPVYATERFNGKGNSPQLAFFFDGSNADQSAAGIPVLAPGEYLVELYFAELFATANGARVFDLSIEGTEVLSDFDIYAQAAALAADGNGLKVGLPPFRFIVTVTDGVLNIDSNTEVDNAKVGGICVAALNVDQNTPPVANDDTAETDEGVAITIDVLNNDTDADIDDILTIESVTQPTNGGAAIENGQIVYTPAVDFFGEDTFTYTINDGNDGTDTASVTVTVTEVIVLPTEYTITATAGAGGSISPDGAVTVTEGGSQTFSIVAEAGFEIADVLVDGTSVGAVPSYEFSDVQADATIEATFSEIVVEEEIAFCINIGGTAGTAFGRDFLADNGGGQNTPYFTNGGSKYGGPSQAPTQGNLTTVSGSTLSGYEEDIFQTERYGGALQNGQPNPMVMELGLGGNLPTALSADGTLPNGEYVVDLYFAEIFVGVQAGGVGQGVGYRIFSVALEGTEIITDLDMFAEYDPLTAFVVTNTATVTDNSLTVSFDASKDNGKISAVCVTPAETVNEDTTDPAITLNGDDPVELSVGDEYVEPGVTVSDDTDADIALRTVITSNVNTAEAGMYTVSYEVLDRAGNSAQVSRVVNVTAANTPPVITPIEDIVINEGQSISVPIEVTDAEGGVNVNVSIISSDFQSVGGFNFDGSLLTWNTPPVGEYDVTVTANDGDNVVTEMFTITVADVNAVPVAVDDAYTTDEGIALTINAADGVLFNDTDADDDDVLTATLVQTVNNGTLTLEEDGSFTYTPAAGFSGEDTFTYTAFDGTDNSNEAAVTITVEAAVVAVPSALFEINPNEGLGASTFSGSAYQLTNTSQNAQITSISIDLSTGILPDMVFDPVGSGGDATSNCLTANSGAAATGFVAPADPCVNPFSIPRNGGFDVLTIDFTDFNPGEQFFFTTDIDPNSIQGVPGAGNAGAVSGYELVGATITVTFSDGTSISSSLFEDGSLGGSQAILAEGATSAPTIAAQGVTSPAIVNDLQQTILVTGTPGDYYSLLQMDTRLFIASGDDPFDVTPAELPFYANEAMQGKVVFTGQIDADGTVEVPVSLLQSPGSNGTPDGGLNYFIAVTSSTPYAVDQQTSQTSNVIVLKYEEVVNTAPSIFLLGVADPVSVQEDGITAVQISVTDAEDNLESVVVTGVDFLTVTEGLNGIYTISFEPEVGDAGEYVITITATDEADAVTTEEFALVVTPLQSTSLTGSFSVQGIMNYSGDVAVGLYPVGSTTPIDTFTLAATAGEFVIADIAPGTYQIAVKTAQTLQVVEVVTVVEGSNTADFGQLATGDINGDDVVSSLDFSLLAGTFNLGLGDAGYNAAADLNGDDVVSSLDFSLLAQNFNSAGENLQE